MPQLNEMTDKWNNNHQLAPLMRFRKQSSLVEQTVSDMYAYDKEALYLTFGESGGVENTNNFPVDIRLLHDQE